MSSSGRLQGWSKPVFDKRWNVVKKQLYSLRANCRATCCAQDIQRSGRWRHKRPQRYLRNLHTFRANSGGSNWSTDPASPLDEFKKVQAVQLDASVRRAVEDAINSRNYRVTVGDVAATAGIKTTQAEEALRALAADALATLSVSQDGEILYTFPQDFRSIVRNKSLLLQLEPVVGKVVEAAAYVVRISFGTALITSVIATTLAIAAISSSRDDRNRNSSYHHYSGGGLRLWFNLSDVLWYWDPWYAQRRAQAIAISGVDPGMSFLEAVFSFVFGDGDPNIDFERRRWEAIGRYIQYRGGVVTAEELAPFLDLKSSPSRLQTAAVVDESYVLPVLTRFNGSPEVDDKGNILYTFPQLQQTGSSLRRTLGMPDSYVLEKPWTLTVANPGQLWAVIALGIANFVAVFALSNMLTVPANVVALLRSGMGWILYSMPFLQVYAAAFFGIPAIRWYMNRRRNADIDKRNILRKHALSVLQEPTPELKVKLKSAGQLSTQKVIQDDDVVYRSDKALDEQLGGGDVEGERWERRLRQRDMGNRRQF